MGGIDKIDNEDMGLTQRATAMTTWRGGGGDGGGDDDDDHSDGSDDSDEPVLGPLFRASWVALKLK